MITRLLVVLLLSTTATATRAAAQAPYTGAWDVRGWRAAPWVDAARARTLRPEARVLGRRVTFEPRRVRGPSVMACAGPKYEVLDVPPDGLFEGGLPHPATDARTLGFRHSTIPTLRPGCDFDYHFVSRDSGLFALDDVIYTMVRVRR